MKSKNYYLSILTTGFIALAIISTVLFWCRFLCKKNIIEAARRLLENFLTLQLSSRVTPEIKIDSKTGVYRLSFVPDSLADAVRLQFADSVCQNRQFKDCEVCGRPFEISPDTARVNRTLCSNACKTKSYRRRRTQARQLHADGKSARVIAGAVGSDFETVKGWVAAVEKPRRAK